MNSKNKRLIIILISAVSLLLIPFLAMQFTNEVGWKVLDFIIMGILLSGTGLFFELVLRKFKEAGTPGYSLWPLLQLFSS